MKKVLIFSIAYYPEPVGGAEVAIKEITDRIDPGDIEFHMITPHYNRAWPETEKIGNVIVHRVGFSADNPKLSDRNIPTILKISKVLYPFTAAWHARKLHKELHFDGTWAMMASYASFAALFFKYLRSDVPYLLELQDGNSLKQIVDRQPPVQKVILQSVWYFYKQMFLRADRIKVVSTFLEKLAQEVGYKGPINVVPNAVDTEKFAKPLSQEEKQRIWDKYGKKEGDIFLFTASRLVLSRGVEEVILSLKSLPANVKFLVAGSGDDLEKLQKIAQDAGVSDRVIWAGHKTHDDLPALIHASDIFVRPSIIEGFGNSFVEAMAVGIPVVATAVGGIPDFLFDPQFNPDEEGNLVEKRPSQPPTGIFCEVRNPESVAKAVQRILDDPAMAKEIAANGKKLALEKYDWNLIVKNTREKVFEPLFKNTYNQ